MESIVVFIEFISDSLLLKNFSKVISYFPLLCDREQLEHHRSLRRATYRMRSMNSNAPGDEAPNDGSYSYGRLDDDGYRQTPKQSRPDSSKNPGHSLPRFVALIYAMLLCSLHSLCC